MTHADNYCLRFNDFDNQIKTSWQKFQAETNFCDVTLACEDKQIQAHRLIVSSYSPVLRSILQFNQNSHPLIYLRRVKFRYLQNVLHFMYQGEVNMAEADLSNFLEVAEDLQIRGLSEKNLKDEHSSKVELTENNFHRIASPKNNKSFDNVRKRMKGTNIVDSLPKLQ